MFYQFHEKVFSEDFCQNLLKTSQNIGFEQSKVNIYGEQKILTHIRNNSRIEYQNKILAKEIESIILSISPELYTYQNKKFLEFNDYFRFYQYIPGEYFKAHKDGSVKLDSKKSLITCLIYLNNTDGGETILMPEGFLKRDTWIYIKPTQGSVLLFDHSIWHEAKPVNNGDKIVLRTDVFYQ